MKIIAFTFLSCGHKEFFKYMKFKHFFIIGTACATLLFNLIKNCEAFFETVKYLTFRTQQPPSSVMDVGEW